jgi:hypothetical protein
MIGGVDLRLGLIASCIVNMSNKDCQNPVPSVASARPRVCGSVERLAGKFSTRRVAAWPRYPGWKTTLCRSREGGNPNREAGLGDLSSLAIRPGNRMNQLKFRIYLCNYYFICKMIGLVRKAGFPRFLNAKLQPKSGREPMASGRIFRLNRSDFQSMCG